jgi:inorganic pyrophosphatase
VRIVTSGSQYIDIDAYGATVAYAELLNLQGVAAKAVTSAPINASVPPSVKAWGAPIDQHYVPTADDTFTLVDLSDPTRFDRLVDHEKIDEVIDHHPGHVNQWHERPDVKTDIEFVGSACTMIFERWQKAGLISQMSALSAKLLMCGILDNTLNFKATISTARDRTAYDQLLPISGLPNDWPKRYFSDCEQLILSDLPKAIRDDTKKLDFAGRDQPVVVGQIAIWDAEPILQNNLAAFDTTLSKHDAEWFANIISINDGRSHFYCKDENLKHWLSRLLELKFAGDIATTNRMWLRKEILKQAIEKGGRHEAN